MQKISLKVCLTSTNTSKYTRILTDFFNQIVELLSIYMELEEEKNPVSIYIVMKYCGENLVEYMAKNTVSLEDAAKIVYNIARGLNVWSIFLMIHITILLLSCFRHDS